MSPTLTATFRRMLGERLPNLLRLYPNPFVTAACHALGRYAATTWGRDAEAYQTFLANGFDEALGGAVKLARYDGAVADRPATGLVLDAADRLGPFASADVPGGRIEFVPGLVVAAPGAAPAGGAFGFVVLIPRADGTLGGLEPAARAARDGGALVVVCVTRDSLAALRRAPNPLADLPADIVVFDESFVNRDVPFAAFTARAAVYDHWNKPGKGTFHSTTFQPNTVSSLHFLNCLEAADPPFWAATAAERERIHADLAHRGEQFRTLYSPSLRKVIRASGFDTPNVTADGDFVTAGERRVFDAVSGVACSVRGHNPPNYVEELAALECVDAPAEVAARLGALTGLGNVLPAVSGAGGIEAALRLALVANHPKRTVLALKSGFGGKSLLALAGTWSPKYKQRIDPLYPDVVYVDPFAPDALAQIDAALAAHPVAVAQTELIQAVGGVRRVPDAVLTHLAAKRREHGYFLLVDEVQTGMYRTGPFTLSAEFGLAPDLLVIGKGTSDMMFPFALTLYSDAVGTALARAGSDLPDAIRRRHDYPVGYRTVLNVLRRADGLRLSERVAASGALFADALRAGLAGCKGVREVRAFGLLVGIELNTRGWSRRWLKKWLYSLYLLALLRHPRFPVLAGFCQYEPNVLKLTPGLTADPADLRRAAAAVAETLRRPLPGVLAGAVAGLAGGSKR